MKKEILNEINRNREIMGLKELMMEAWNLKSGSRWKDFLQTYKPNLYDNVETVRPDISGGYNFMSWSRTLWKALKNKYKEGKMDRVDGDGNEANWKFMAWMLRPDMLESDDGLTEDVVLQPVTRDQLKSMGANVGGSYWKKNDRSHGLSQGDLVVHADGDYLSPSEFCRQINRFNITNFGTTQITSWAYNKGDGETETNRETDSEFLYQFSASRTSKTRKEIETPGTPGTETIVAAEGEPIPGGSAFAPNEVIPDATKIEELLTAIQAAAAEGNTVTNVSINGVASKMAIDKIDIWKKNVGSEYNTMSDADITKLVIGDFTEPVTGNQVLAYLRAQNLGKELIKAGLAVDSYTYSVGGDEMKADVLITTQTPSVEGTKGTKGSRSTELGVDTEDLSLDSKVLAMIISVPEGDITWKHDSWDRSGAKKKSQEVIIANNARGGRI